MIKITIKSVAGYPRVIISDRATGAIAPFGGANMLFRTKRTGSWGRFNQRYFTPDDRQHLLNEAKQFAEGFEQGVAYARYQISRVDDNQPVIDYKPDDLNAVRQHEEALRRKSDDNEVSR
jgi:hypothetical protein